MENNILSEVGFVTFKMTFIFKIMDDNTAGMATPRIMLSYERST